MSATALNDLVQVAVQDNGFGIEKRHQERIFERFYRVKDDNTRYITGTGLGLPIVKGIVDDLGGSIELKSAPGKGKHVHRRASLVISISAIQGSGVGDQAQRHAVPFQTPKRLLTLSVISSAEAGLGR